MKITPHLWYVTEAEDAAKFYTSIFPDSRVDRVAVLPADTPSGPEGSVKLVSFTLFGQPFQAISAGPLDPFNHSVSFVVHCDTQAEIDRYWEALGKEGQFEMCGWVRDKYGLAWQIVPSQLDDMITDKDRARAKRVAEVMLKMRKLDIARLQAAYGVKDGVRPS